MKNGKTLLPTLFSIALALSLILPVSAASAAVFLPDDHPVNHPMADSSSLVPAMPPNMPQGSVTPMVAAGWLHTVGLRPDGTVIAVGWNLWGQCNVGNWRDIIQVAAGGGDVGQHTVGLRADGTVLAVGDNSAGQCEVDDWNDIVQVAAGDGHTAGLKSNGTVVAVGYNNNGQCDVAGWTDIVQIAASYYFTVGLRSDRTVVTAGPTWQRQLDTSKWTDIVQIVASLYDVVGLESDGTVVTAGPSGTEQSTIKKPDTSNWTEIVQIAAYLQVVGLKADGTVVATGDNRLGQCEVDDWKDIVQVAAGAWHTVGLKADGAVVAVGYVGCARYPFGRGYNSTEICDQVTASITIELAKWHLGAVKYVLTISSTRGGSVTTPGEGVFPYNGGAALDLVAEPEEGYRFVRWTGDVIAVGNSSAALTTISMRGNYSVTANFKWLAKWPLIGTAAGVIAAGLAILFARKKIAAGTKEG